MRSVLMLGNVVFLYARISKKLALYIAMLVISFS